MRPRFAIVLSALLVSLWALSTSGSPPLRESLPQGVVISWPDGVIEAPGSSAADLRAPSAEIALIRAERLARERAAERMKAALAGLPGARTGQLPKDLDTLVASAQVAAIDYGASGSVSLRLSLKLPGLLPPDKNDRNDKKGKSSGHRGAP
jgi:hypothetical protein